LLCHYFFFFFLFSFLFKKKIYWFTTIWSFFCKNQKNSQKSKSFFVLDIYKCPFSKSQKTFAKKVIKKRVRPTCFAHFFEDFHVVTNSFFKKQKFLKKDFLISYFHRTFIERGVTEKRAENSNYQNVMINDFISRIKFLVSC